MRAFSIMLVVAATAFVGCSMIVEAQAFLPAFLSVDPTICTVPLLAGYLSEVQCAEQLGVNRRTLWRWRKARTAPAHTMVGGAVMYRVAAVQAWLLSREQKPPRERSRARSKRTDNQAAA